MIYFKTLPSIRYSVFSFGSPRSYSCETEGSIELYHIERCVDPDCVWPNPSESSLSPRKRYLDDAELPGSGNEWDMGTLTSELSPSRLKIRIRRHSMSGASITRVLDAKEIAKAGNLNKKLSDRIWDEVINEDIPMKTLKKKESVQITRVKYAEKPRPNSTDTYVHGRVQTSQSVRIARVTSFLAKTPTIDPSNEEPCSSTHLNNISEVHNRYHSSRNFKKNQVTVTRVPFAHQKKQSKRHFLLPDDATHSSLGGSSSAISMLPHSRKRRRISTSITQMLQKKIKDN